MCMCLHVVTACVPICTQSTCDGYMCICVHVASTCLHGMQLCECMQSICGTGEYVCLCRDVRSEWIHEVFICGTYVCMFTHGKHKHNGMCIHTWYTHGVHVLMCIYACNATQLHMPMCTSSVCFVHTFPTPFPTPSLNTLRPGGSMAFTAWATDTG